MKNLTFITGNQNKADYLARFLSKKISHHKLDLDELQSLDLHAVIEHKARQAYKILKAPVLVEDVALVLPAMSRLPGTFIKWFLEELGSDGLAKLASTLKSQEAHSHVCYALYDGQEMHFFEGEMAGKIASKPAGERGFGFDRIFINDGYDVTRGQMSQEEYDLTSARFKALHKLKAHLENK